MTLSGLLDVAAADSALARALKSADAHLDLVAPPALRPVLGAALARERGRTVLMVTATAREAEDLTAALTSLLDPAAVAHFPAWETLPHERLSPRSDTVGQRLAVLRRLAHGDPEDPAAGPLQAVVAPVRAVLQPIVAGLGDLEPVRLRPGDEADLDDAVRRLVDAGYNRVDLVEKRGEIAVRGGILDVFPPTEEHPLRVEFWGDQVEEVRYFKAADQRSLEVAQQGLWAPPCRELPLTESVRERARELGREHPALADILQQIADGSAVEGMEAFAPVLADHMELLLDVLPDGSSVVVCDPERIRTRAAELVSTSQEFLEASWVNAAAGGEAPIDLGAAAFRTLEEVRDRTAELGLAWWTITPFASAESAGADPAGGRTRREYSAATGELTEVAVDEAPDADGDGALRIGARAAESYRGDTQRVMADVKGWIHEEWRVVLVTEGHGPAERLAEVVREEGLGAKVTELPGAPEPAIVNVSCGLLDHGFVWDAVKLAVLTETDLSGQKSSTKDMRRMPSRRRGGVDPLRLTVGDYIVHEQHGVGRYVEMASRTVQGATREYLIIEYAKGDRLFVPTDQLDEVTRYVGGEAPSLHRLGGAEWQKQKGRARKAVRQIAGELIRLYSARQASPGHAFQSDTPWQRELEDAFPYIETPDQLAAIDEVKSDMEKPVPMDRLICGDVGYGKTEIAVRAAFKAVQDGKQVAVLVPTTLLVQQHLSTFTERFASFPVVIKPISRFQTDKEVVETLRGVADGTVDLVIGTHRLLSPETRFKDLGLIIIDEEQRFGVEHKERLKEMRTQVDVLAMSATPIPRTLEMGLTGIREMSTILTPPEERHPVLTFVGPYDDKQIAAAIRRELLREGQVFFVHNRVRSIDKVAKHLTELVPEARVGVAHGQMNEHQLEKIMVDFWEKEYDVLVATTIVESGLDIPNANTLIVDRADMYGLSQLHQLRGRVGRGRERAYAYFLYPPETPLTETAHERLATIAQHTEMGAGMFVAMKDLEIRGAGNVLGAEQSGHIAGVGFDLYVRMVGEAVRELREEGVPETPEVKVELPVDAHIPHEYVPGERLRLDAYRRIAAIQSDDEIVGVRDELADRFGPPPVPVLNLLEVARFRALARRGGLTDVTLQGNHIRFSPVSLPESRTVRLQRLYPKSILKTATNTLLVPVPKTAPLGGRPLRDQELLKWCTDLVEALFLPDPVAR
ncbi:transcription-repair coupling factor [Actinoallomurus rhizosphaericola]|uniref:transcription-repair coupling factor n=1 Tax=Actinoallomurus rhizosphaericola TaxID=2952536 RepID=UPI0020917B88|nr:transcription-repair coupling factor [Actinoallomurus rhizosphaericola]MCO5992778.1 transcription-repair coupling factor [Actinoallomurus rhizosphaericola]